MLNRMLLLNLFLRLPFLLTGQPDLNLLESFHNESSQPKLLELSLQISESHNLFPLDTLKFYSEYAIRKANKKGDKVLEGRALLNLGNAFLVYGDYGKALESFYRANFIFEELNDRGKAAIADRNYLAKSLGSIGIVLSEQGSYAKALQFHFKASVIYEATANLDKLSSVYNNIGIEYQSLNKYEDAIAYFEKCLDIQEERKSPFKGITLTNIANNYLKRDQPAEAIVYYKRAKLHFEKYPDARGEGELYNNLGAFQLSLGDEQKAYAYLQRALLLFQEAENKFGLSDTYFYLGDYYLSLSNTVEALLNYKTSLELSKELGVLERQGAAELAIAVMLESDGDYKLSIEHYKHYYLLKDSLETLNSENALSFSGLQADFEKKALVFKASLDQSMRNLWIAILSCLFLLMGGGVFFQIYRKKQMLNRLELEKTLLSYKQKALHLQMNPHFIFNCLGSIASFIIQKENDNAFQYLTNFSKLMRLTLENSKEDYITVEKEMESLAQYLALEKLRHLHIFDYVISKDDDVEEGLCIPPMLLQPLAENSIIHGISLREDFKGFIRIHFSMQADRLKCKVTDNGVGVETSKRLKADSINTHQSLALDLIEERVVMLTRNGGASGKFTISEIKESGEIKGTEVEILFPVCDD